MTNAYTSNLTRWLKFNVVGAVGIAVQLTILELFVALGVNYLLATALAVESAVLHNFLWHERFTWCDHVSADCGTHDAAARLLRFNLSNGAISIAGNLLIMRLLVGGIHLPALVANLVSIAACSLLNFLVSDRWVFRRRLWNHERAPSPVNPEPRDGQEIVASSWNWNANAGIEDYEVIDSSSATDRPEMLPRRPTAIRYATTARLANQE